MPYTYRAQDVPSQCNEAIGDLLQQAVAARDAAERRWQEATGEESEAALLELIAAERRLNRAVVEAKSTRRQDAPAPVPDTWETAFHLAGPVLRILAYGLFAAIVVAQVAGWVR